MLTLKRIFNRCGDGVATCVCLTHKMLDYFWELETVNIPYYGLAGWESVIQILLT